MSQLDLARPGAGDDSSPEPGPALADLCLVAPIGEPIWLGRTADGGLVLARRLPEDTDPAADRAGRPARITSLATLRAPSVVSVLGVRQVHRARWLVSEFDDGVSLSRLLQLTRPSPAQAVVIGLDVLHGVRTLHTAGYPHGDLCAAEVRIGGDGQVRLDGWAVGALRNAVPLTQRQRADLAAVGGLLADLAAAVRSSPPSADASAPALLAALDAAADHAARPRAAIEVVAAPLAAAGVTGEDNAVRTELAALVTAVTGRGFVAALLPHAAASATASTPAESRQARFWAAVHGGWKWIWAWVVALMVLMGVVGLEFTILHEPITHNLRLLLGSGSPGQGPDSRAGPTQSLPPVSLPARASSGVVRGVDLRALEPCTPGAVCAVRVLVRLQPQPHAQPSAVEWTFQVVDRCTGSQRDVPGGAIVVAPGGDQVSAVNSMTLPQGRFLAVIAVTNQPARAASRPLLVPADQDSC